LVGKTVIEEGVETLMHRGFCPEFTTKGLVNRVDRTPVLKERGEVESVGERMCFE
jgi:hypothetical protein